VIRVEQESRIDTSFDFRSDTPPGRDPDRWSVTLRSYHRRLWSKALPCGIEFDLDATMASGYLHHRSALGEFWLSSDTVIPTYRSWTGPRELVGILHHVDPADLDAFQRIGYSIGAMLVFPGVQIGRQWTINQARGMLRPIGDRLDLTLECIRRHYRGEPSPMSEVLTRYGDFFDLFDDFRGYVDFFLLDDLTTNGGSSVTFLLPFDDFRGPALPQDLGQYQTYRLRSVEFVTARNARIASSDESGHD
jgi:hypothetical protein